MKIKPCIIGLGYVGLPLALEIAKKYETVGIDLDKKRVITLKKKIDINNSFKREKFFNKKIKFTNKLKQIKNCNFYIICVPTPIYKNKSPNLRPLEMSIHSLAKIIKKNDIIIIESTVYPGVTEKLTKYIENKTKLTQNKDFFIGYSPERINPGDKKNTLKNINKILALKTKNKEIKRKISKVYNLVSEKLIHTSGIKEAETAKVIENIQRDLNIALMNEILMICEKLQINYSEVLRLAKTKWNFIKFLPGLVGGHCLPVDPYYLSNIAKKSKIISKVILAGRKTNDQMEMFVINFLKKFLSIKKMSPKNTNILIVGLTYKYGVPDMRNSLNFNIFQKIKKFYNKTDAYDPFVNQDIKNKFRILSKIESVKSYDIILLLSKGRIFKDFFNKLKKNKKQFLLDPFRYYT